MQYVVQLENIQQYDRITAGGKAANLGKLINAGLPVPPGFIVLASAYERFVTENSLQAEIERLAQTVSLTDQAAAEQAAVAPAALGPGGIPLPDPEPTDSFLQGLPASAGRVRGMARVVRSIDETSRLSAGDILVTQGTDPGWTPVFPLVSGLVLEVGGQLSHGAIIAREYGIPAIINVPGAMHFIQDGQTIEVDGNSGRVYLEVTS